MHITVTNFYNISSSYTPNVWEDKTEEEKQEYFGITGHRGLDKAVKDNKVYRGYYWDKKRCNDYSERK